MNSNARTCKTILIGESGVGKSCIIYRFINDKFDESATSTTGANYITKHCEFEEFNKSILFQIWDTAGQEKYRGLAKIFYKHAKIIILVYDICDKKSFEELKEYWYKQIKETVSDKVGK